MCQDTTYGPGPTGLEPAYDADYAREAEEHYALQATQEWLRRVRQRPDLFNFTLPGPCANGKMFIEPVPAEYCGGYLNEHGLCEACQCNLNDLIETAEDEAYGRWR